MRNIMDAPIVTETHERKAHMLIRSPELDAMVRAAACQKCGIADGPAVRVEITYENEKEGSPAYPTRRYRACVTLIEDQLKLGRSA